MLTLALLLIAVSAANSRPFNITYLMVPEVVWPGQDEVDIECRYDANFTILNWFKGSTEFFRYKPGAAPSTRSFPILGVGRIQLVACGPTACRLKLGGLSEEASGLYRCDIERDAPPHLFESRKAYMQVHGHEHRKPLLEGLAEEYAEGELIQAYCRAAPDSEIRWYINGHEMEDTRGKATLKKNSSRFDFVGLPPTMTMQCAEFRYGRLLGSKEFSARLKEVAHIKREEREKEKSNGVSLTSSNLRFISALFILNSLQVFWTFL
ncbi:uncharacterized protein LOC114253471 [Bombyx mandarina]|uniref:Uncharacterized protein LOC114253471 n=1 Tax=Bombyx mandarina TaxID=7092 RepID=A0A6J2KRI9_BOMMA|nr:uncharacterized protein LOC114253471 [Bombyx mandarina]